MRKLLFNGLACSSLLALAMAVGAQDRERTVVIEKEYHQTARTDDWWKGRLFERVRDDLNHVQAVTPEFSSDDYRLNDVKRELGELQAKMAESRYDQPELEDVIKALDRVVTDNHLTASEREMLTDDLNRLKGFREHHDGFR